MARIRTIKPEFFTSSDIIELTPLSRLFYVALWCESDREGRLNWNPKTFKLRYFPADKCDIIKMSEELIEVGLIIIYEADGREYAEIPSFQHHQVINNREAASVIPARVKAACVTRESGVQGEGREGKEGKGKEGRNIYPLAASDADDPILSRHECPHQEIIALYHEVLPQCPQVRDWTTARATQLRARWNEESSRQDLAYWRRFFEYVAGCDFLVGRGAGNKPFFADLEWMTKAANFTKIREAKYENRSAA